MSGKCTRRCCYCSLFSSCKRQGKLMKREGLQRQTAPHIYHRKHPRYKGAQKTNAPTFEDEEEDQAYDDVWPPQLSSSARRYQELEEEFPDLPIRQHVPTQGRGFSPVPQRRSAPSPATSQPNLPPGVTIINGVPCVNVGGRWVEVEIVLHNGVPPPTQKQRGNKNKAHPPEIVYGLAAVGRETEQQRGPRSRFHWLVFVGMAVCTMLVGWILLTMLSQWWQVTTDDWHYGRPRTYQTDQAVGHGDSAAHPSHFIALNIRSHIEIIEFPQPGEQIVQSSSLEQDQDYLSQQPTIPLVPVNQQVSKTWPLAPWVVVFMNMAFCLAIFFLDILPILTNRATITLVPKQATIATVASVPLQPRVLAPLVLTQRKTVPATQHIHQNAAVATGELTFYNALQQPQYIAAGTLVTTSSGVNIVTTQDATIPAGDGVTNGYASVAAQTTDPGPQGNIAAYAINGTCCREYVLVKNLSSFLG